MSHTWGEIMDLRSQFFKSLEKQSGDPEEYLKKDNIIKAFLSFMPDSYKSDFQEEAIYEEILNLKDDVSGEYKHLKQQFDELKTAIDNKEQYFISSKISNPNTPEQEAENKKLKEYCSQLKNIREEISQVNLIQMALRNSQKSIINLSLIKDDFTYKLFQVNTLNNNRRKYINFSGLPVSVIKNIPNSQTDHDNYMMYFGRMIINFQILERIQDKIKQNPLISERLHSAIWNENMPEIFEQKGNFTTLDGDIKEYNINKPNNEPLSYYKLVEIINQNKLCPKEWYESYKRFVDKRDQIFQKYIQ